MIYQLEDTDLLKWFREQDVRCGIIHQANAYQCFGAGIAKSIREQFPEAYEADKKTKYGDKDKLGTFSVAQLNGCFKFIYNLYGQWQYGRRGRNTSYDAVEDGLLSIVQHAYDNDLARLGLPFNMGCRLGGGNWKVVRAIIESIFPAEAVDLYICRYEP